jgi:hypothetical protein
MPQEVVERGIPARGTTMNQLDKIPLSKIRVVDPWSNAAKGALLQISVQGKTAIGMRCNYQVAVGCRC